jgi:archaellum component FlaC
VVDYGFRSHERNYTTNLEKLKEKVFEFVSSYIIYHQNYIEYYEKELYDCKESLETLKEKTKHLFETPEELAQGLPKVPQNAL